MLLRVWNNFKRNTVLSYNLLREFWLLVGWAHPGQLGHHQQRSSCHLRADGLWPALSSGKNPSSHYRIINKKSRALSLFKSYDFFLFSGKYEGVRAGIYNQQVLVFGGKGARSNIHADEVSHGPLFSVTRRSRSDESDSVSQWVSVSTDLTDVTLVSDDTYWRLYWCCSVKWEKVILWD